MLSGGATANIIMHSVRIQAQLLETTLTGTKALRIQPENQNEEEVEDNGGHQ